MQQDHLVSMAPNNTSALSEPTGSNMSTWYEQMHSHQQFSYPGWGYAASYVPQNYHAEATNLGYHHFSYYPLAQYPPAAKDGMMIFTFIATFLILKYNYFRFTGLGKVCQL